QHRRRRGAALALQADAHFAREDLDRSRDRPRAPPSRSLSLSARSVRRPVRARGPRLRARGVAQVRRLVVLALSACAAHAPQPVERAEPPRPRTALDAGIAIDPDASFVFGPFADPEPPPARTG